MRNPAKQPQEPFTQEASYLMKLRIKQRDIITTGWMRAGPNPDQPKTDDRGWMIYPEEHEGGMIPVMIVKIKNSP